MYITGNEMPQKARYEETVHYLTTWWTWKCRSWVSQVQVLKKL